MKTVTIAGLLLLAISLRAEKVALDDALSPRQDILLSSGWRFNQADAPSAEAPAFADSLWQSVRVPHCWNIKPGQGDQGDLYEGAGWYRLHLKTDVSMTGKSLFLKFDAAYHTAEVFINGKFVGSHVGGFAAFCFDVTRFLRVGEDNIVAVKVSFHPPFPSIPLTGDYTKFPGLYRDVHLLVLNKVSISPLDYASCGVYLKQASVNESSARVEVTTKLRNADASAQKVTVRCHILDAQETEVQQTVSEQNIPPSSQVDSVQTVTLARPHLWNGRTDPYLYHAVVEVMDRTGLTDRMVQPLGLRYFRADEKNGFFLNGKPYSIHGVNRHQDRYNKGWAISPADMDEDLAILLDLGCTGIRLAHYQHADYFHDLCDKAGPLVWAELPLIGGGWTAKELDNPDKNPPPAPGAELNSKAFEENARQQLIELIRQNYNHPSIVFWSIWNEIGGPREEPDKSFIMGLNALAKELDPTRLTTAASNDSKNKTTELVGRNAYYGWYGGKPDELAAQLPIFLEADKGRPLIISEYGAGASILQHQTEPFKVAHKSPWHPEEWQAIVHEEAWKALVHAPYLNAIFVWLGFDCASLVRNEGDHRARNDKGLVTADRTIRKDAFYFYKANWSSEPMVYITSRRFTPRPSGTFPVKVYSNCAAVELKINGRSQGVIKGQEQGIFVWPTVVLPDGDVHVEVIGQQNGKVVKDECIWKCSADAPARLDLSVANKTRA